MDAVWIHTHRRFSPELFFRVRLYPNRLIDGRRERGRDRREKQGHDAT